LAQFKRSERPEVFSIWRKILLNPSEYEEKDAWGRQWQGNEFSLSVLRVYRREIPFTIPLAVWMENSAPW
jgi:hypothetical protein